MSFVLPLIINLVISILAHYICKFIDKQVLKID